LLHSLILTRHETLLLSGFTASSIPKLLSPRGQLATHGAYSILAGAITTTLVLAGLEAPLRWPVGLAFAFGLAAFVAHDLKAIALAGAFGSLAGVAGLFARARLSTAPVDVVASATLVGMGIAAVSFALARSLRALARRRSGLDALARLHAEIDRFNAIVSAAKVNDELIAIRGGRHDLLERQRILGTLWRARTELVTALACERILRESRELDAIVNLHFSEADRIRTLARHHVTTFDDRLSLAISVREEFERMHPHWTLHPSSRHP
jgi:hypothetical protein